MRIQLQAHPALLKMSILVVLSRKTNHSKLNGVYTSKITDEKEVILSKKLLNDGDDSGFVFDSVKEHNVLVSRNHPARL